MYTSSVKRNLVLLCALSTVSVLGACSSDDGPPTDAGAARDGGSADGAGGRLDAGITSPDAAPGDVTVAPARIDDVLANPNMGFADFHFGWWCNLPPIDFTPAECATRAEAHRPANYPETAVAYFRWTWRDLEPVRGEINFALIDAAIQSANLLGETLAFRVMTIEEGAAGIPDWMLAAPYAVAGQRFGGTFWPDYRDPTFLAEHARFVRALGARYDDHPAVDHVDIGSVGCWGEWNTACLTGVDSIIEVYAPASDAERDDIAAAYRQLIDDFAAAFPTTPRVMLGIGSSPGLMTDIFVHAIRGGAGWRVDCWGDWGWFSPTWSHQDNLYPDMIANASAVYPEFADVWQHAPIQLEVCATMEDWQSRGWTAAAPDGQVYKSFQWALAQHAAVLNAKSSPVPDEYVPAVQDLLRHNGYRYVIDSFNHASTVEAGTATTLRSTWSNLGVTPSYTRRTLSYRLRSGGTTRTFDSPADVRTWLPGTFEIVDTVTVAADMPAGTYELEVAIVDRAGTSPTTAPLPPLALAIEGRTADGWYPISGLTVR